MYSATRPTTPHRPQTPLRSLTPLSSSSLSSSPLTRKAPVSEDNSQNVQVTVRCRPLNSTETLSQHDEVVWNVNDGDTERVCLADDYAERNRRPLTEYYFDHVVSGSNNKKLYDTAVGDLVRRTMEGYNGTVFAYGQTSSGKTYTMMGVESQPGVIPQAIDDVFSCIRESTTKEFLLRVSYLEIYNEQIRDLLQPDASDIRIHEDKRRGVYVSPLKEEIVTSAKQVMKIIQKGEANRHISTTDYNEHSSRSHTIFQMVIESRERSGATSPGSNLATRRYTAIGSRQPTTSVKFSQLNLIDLAGSEKASTSIDRRKEGSYINKSLLTLGSVIAKLTEEKGGHIPFRDSKLTRILQSSLTGNARVSVICTFSPAIICVEESTNTLKFASRLKKLHLNPQANQALDDKALLQKYRNEIAELKARLAHTADGIVAAEKEKELSQLKAEKHKHESEMAEMQLIRSTLKERIDHLTKLILTSSSVTSKPILDWTPSPSSSSMTARIDVPLGIGDMSLDKEKNVYIRQLKAQLQAKNAEITDLTARLEQVTIERDMTVDGESPTKANALPFSDQDRAEISKLRQANAELEIIVKEQATKIDKLRDEIELEFRAKYGVPFDQTAEYTEMKEEINELRETVTEKDEELHTAKSLISELRDTVRKTELAQFQQAETHIQERTQTPTPSSSTPARNGVIPPTGKAVLDMNLKIRQLDSMLQNERQQRLNEQEKAYEKIAGLEADLTITRAELAASRVGLGLNFSNSKK